MADVDTKKLRELAEAATPGPWRHNPAATRHEPVWRVEYTARGANRGASFVVADVQGTERNDVANAAFIAAANPQAVLALLDDLAAKQIVADAMTDSSASLRAQLADANAEIERLRSVVSVIGEVDDDSVDELRSQIAAMTAARDEACNIGRELVAIALDLVNGRAPSISTSEMVRRRADRVAELRKPGAPPSAPICTTCNDTHSMPLNGTMVSCTRCPTPCQDCRYGGVGPLLRDDAVRVWLPQAKGRWLMRIKVFSLVDERDGKPAAFEVADAEVRLRVRVWHDGAWFELAVDQQNRLTLREVEGRQLIIQPRASNEVRIAAEPWR